MSRDGQQSTKRPRRIYIGYDGRQQAAFAVARMSAQAHTHAKDRYAPIEAVMVEQLQKAGLYTRRLYKALNEDNTFSHYYDPISGANMSTAFAISRFFVMYLGANEPVLRQPGFNDKTKGWALFMDCDMLVRDNLDSLFSELEKANDTKAIFCVKHKHEPPEGTKMDGQLQQLYLRKNWSSVMAFNLDHPANKKLTLDMCNELPGRDLHRFCWLEDDELIGSLDPKWNFLVGYSDPTVVPSIVHYTEGGPWLATTHPEFENLPFADEWLSYITGK
jgi:hypothetical protein